MQDVVTVDSGYLGIAEHTAAYLLVEGDEAAFVETNTQRAVPRLLEALDRAGRRPEDVRYVLITHIHLDHAGGASALMEACPNATLVAHPRAAKHAIDPGKLIKSAQAVYGEAEFQALYGEIRPIPEERVLILEDGESVEFAGRLLRALHTRGHANHHFVLHDEERGRVFTGDAFGIVYPALQGEGRYVFPSTSPTDFDGPAAKEAVDRIVSTGAETAFFTHFGGFGDLPQMAAQLHPWLDRSIEIAEAAYASALEDDELDDLCQPLVQAAFEDSLAGRALRDDPNTWKVLEIDIRLNAQGLAFAAKKRRFKEAKARGEV